MDKRSVNEKREMIIAQSLESPQGRVALAQAMVEPIRRALEYQAVGRKLLMVDELPQGAYARYEKDVRALAYVLPRRGATPDIQKVEDSEIFTVISNAVDADHTVVATGGALTITALNQAFSTVEQHDLTVGKVVCHAFRYADIRNWGKTVYDEATTKQVLTTGLFGHIWTADIHVSSRMPTDTVFVLAPAEYLGAFPIRQDITVLPADDPKKLRLGWVIYEEVGIVVINNYAAAKVTVTSGS
jgi:hypothetical protein